MRLTYKFFGVVNPLTVFHPNRIFFTFTTNQPKAIVWRANNYAFDRSVAYDSIGGMKSGYPGQSKDDETGLWQKSYAIQRLASAENIDASR